jgi:hypothetical protein
LLDSQSRRLRFKNRRMIKCLADGEDVYIVGCGTYFYSISSYNYCLIWRFSCSSEFSQVLTLSFKLSKRPCSYPESVELTDNFLVLSIYVTSFMNADSCFEIPSSLLRSELNHEFHVSASSAPLSLSLNVVFNGSV